MPQLANTGPLLGQLWQTLAIVSLTWASGGSASLGPREANQCGSNLGLSALAQERLSLLVQCWAYYAPVCKPLPLSASVAIVYPRLAQQAHVYWAIIKSFPLKNLYIDCK